jgi:putative two-component system response regulator
MNGYETIAKLKSDPATADIPVIFLTSVSSEEVHAKSQECDKWGTVGYISKPFSPPLMLERLTAFFNGTQTEVERS